jgi:hypothetical protein
MLKTLSKKINRGIHKICGFDSDCATNEYCASHGVGGGVCVRRF